MTEAKLQTILAPTNIPNNIQILSNLSQNVDFLGLKDAVKWLHDNIVLSLF